MKNDSIDRGRAAGTARETPFAVLEGVRRFFTSAFFTRHVREEAPIPAPPSEVWRWFTDFASFPDWNPFIREADGTLRVGSTLHIRLRLGRRLIAFEPTVTRLDPAREVHWKTTVLVPGLFDVDRRFALHPTGTEQTTFVQEETNSGLLVPLAYALAHMERDLRIGFRDFSQALALQTAADSSRAQRQDASTNGSGRTAPEAMAPNHAVHH